MDLAATNAPNSMGPGIALARDFDRALVAPVLHQRFPELSYACARVGSGSDVLGLDDDMSRDHDWGLRLQLFVRENEIVPTTAILDQHLPETFRGHPVRFAFSGRPEPRLGIDITSVREFARSRLGFEFTGVLSVEDWLSVSGQAALEVTSGTVFRDPVGQLSRLRAGLAWYPDDLWHYVIACDWQRLDQELPLMGRAGDRGDQLGSAIIAARLVDITVHLAFLLSRRWPPYSKWRGTVFAGLPVAGRVQAPLEAVMQATTWPARNAALQRALEGLAAFQFELGLPSSTRPVRPFWDRPFLCVNPELVPALIATIEDDAVRRLPIGLGSIDQRTDNVDLLHDAWRRRLTIGD